MRIIYSYLKLKPVNDFLQSNLEYQVFSTNLK